jgi:hypothetical protein
MKKNFLRQKPLKYFGFCGLICLLPCLLCGCYSLKLTDPPRSVIEQLLLSRASEDAMKDVDLSWLQGKKIYIEDKYFEGYDKGYAIGVIRECLNKSGALIMKTDDKADVIVEIRSGGLSLKSSETFFGLPSITFPIPLSGPVQTPELAIYKSTKEYSIAKFALFAYVRESGEKVSSTGITSGNAKFYLFKTFGFSWQRTDVPELRKHPKKEEKDNH